MTASIKDYADHGCDEIVVILVVIAMVGGLLGTTLLRMMGGCCQSLQVEGGKRDGKASYFPNCTFSNTFLGASTDAFPRAAGDP